MTRVSQSEISMTRVSQSEPTITCVNVGMEHLREELDHRGLVGILLTKLQGQFERAILKIMSDDKKGRCHWHIYRLETICWSPEPHWIIVTQLNQCSGAERDTRIFLSTPSQLSSPSPKSSPLRPKCKPWAVLNPNPSPIGTWVTLKSHDYHRHWLQHHRHWLQHHRHWLLHHRHWLHR